uniref:PHD-type domain-containing protein n=1 Tax=Arion vulgaris TaxID=1028688 RepID=A0A0B7A9I0_9EUPU
MKQQILLSGCLLDATVLPPYSVSNLRSAETISSIFGNDSFSFLEDLFVQEAWETLHSRIAEKKEKELFSCNSCNDPDNGQYKMIECEGCFEWYHYHCVGMRTTSKPNKWFCVDCWR